jgi:hypothetical protein
LIQTLLPATEAGIPVLVILPAPPTRKPIPVALGPFRSSVTWFVETQATIWKLPVPARWIPLPTICWVKPPVAEVKVVLPVQAPSAPESWEASCCE